MILATAVNTVILAKCCEFAIFTTSYLSVLCWGLSAAVHIIDYFSVWSVNGIKKTMLDVDYMGFRPMFWHGCPCYDFAVNFAIFTNLRHDLFPFLPWFSIVPIYNFTFVCNLVLLDQENIVLLLNFLHFSFCLFRSDAGTDCYVPFPVYSPLWIWVMKLFLVNRSNYFLICWQFDGCLFRYC